MSDEEAAEECEVVTGAATKSAWDFCGVAVVSSSPSSSLIRGGRDVFLNLLETSVGGSEESFGTCGR